MDERVGNMHAFDVFLVDLAHARPRSMKQEFINTNCESGRCDAASKRRRCVGERAPRSDRILSHSWRYGAVGAALNFDAQSLNIL